ncbi:unnamed protein product [Pleuronectes platessa]|uniref:Uncharacterized protein n=1 Tax=Pleuronectes platessa TaxID=8262 RepID=A0A9N7YZW3_PLEPL|nr:unnamed protein product [Pleuronectes platessa]
MRCTSSRGALHPVAHIILRRASSCGAHHPAAHFILRRTSSFGPLHPGAHIGAHRPAASWGAHRRTSSCGAHLPATHIIITAYHPAGHINVRRTSSPHIEHLAARAPVEEVQGFRPIHTEPIRGMTLPCQRLTRGAQETERLIDELLEVFMVALTP